MKYQVMGAALAVCVLSGSALAQLTEVQQNFGFELDWPNANPPRPANARPGNLFAFTNNNDPDARVRALGDAIVPAAQVHGGQRSMELNGPVPAGNFFGFTTDTLDSIAPNFTFLYYDLAISWWAGDIRASVWYFVPTSNPMEPFPSAAWPTDAGEPFVWPQGFAPAALKLEVKGAGNGFQNNAEFDPWSFGFAREARARQFLIAGDPQTNGTWRQVVIDWPAHTPDNKGWKDVVIARSQEDPPQWSLPPLNSQPPNPPAGQTRFPDRLKITIGRWNPSTASTGPGTVFFDDLSVTQLPAGPQACNAADLGGQGGQAGPDGVLDNNDFIVFIDYFFSQNPLADLGAQGGSAGPDGQFDNNDFIKFIDIFFSPCS